MLKPGHPSETLPPDRPDPEAVAKTVRAHWAVTRDRIEAGHRDWSDYFLTPTEPASDRDVERIVSVLADLAERLRSVELLADYAAERAEAANGI